MVGFIVLFDRALDYILQFVSTHPLLSTVRLQCCCLIAAFNGGRSPCSGFPDCPQPQLPASHSSSSRLNPSGYLNNSLHSINPLKTKCVLHNIYKHSVRTSQETRYVSTTNPNLLMLFREQSLFTVRTIRNTQIHYVRRMRCCGVLNGVYNNHLAL
jgi:hypothetical protein